MFRGKDRQGVNGTTMQIIITYRRLILPTIYYSCNWNYGKIMGRSNHGRPDTDSPGYLSLSQKEALHDMSIIHDNIVHMWPIHAAKVTWENTMCIQLHCFYRSVHKYKWYKAGR